MKMVKTTYAVTVKVYCIPNAHREKTYIGYAFLSLA